MILISAVLCRTRSGFLLRDSIGNTTGDVEFRNRKPPLGDDGLDGCKSARYLARADSRENPGSPQGWPQGSPFGPPWPPKAGVACAEASPARGLLVVVSRPWCATRSWPGVALPTLQPDFLASRPRRPLSHSAEFLGSAVSRVWESMVVV